MIEVTLDQMLGSRYHFVKPIHCIKNSDSLVVTEFGIILYCYYLPWRALQTAVLKNAFYRVGQGALRISFLAQKSLGTTVLEKPPASLFWAETIFFVGYCMTLSKKKVKISMLQAVEAPRVM
jgi:hypothetical protein